eukprot:14376633-Alexandrium_andersonii.AAC.1
MLEHSLFCPCKKRLQQRLSGAKCDMFSVFPLVLLDRVHARLPPKPARASQCGFMPCRFQALPSKDECIHKTVVAFECGVKVIFRLFWNPR